MRILRRYILKEHLGPFLVTLGSLTAILLIGNIVKFAELVIGKGVSIIDIIRLLIYLTPYMISFTIPMACLIAMVLAFGRLSSDYEIIAMRASGVSPARLITPMLIVGIVFSCVMLILNDRIVPESHLAFRKHVKAMAVRQPSAYLEAGNFIKEFPPYVIFVYQIRGDKMHNVRIYEPQPEGPARTIIADSGEFERLADKSGVKLILYDGTIDEREDVQPGSFYKVAFKEYSMSLTAGHTDPERLGKKLKELTFREMVEERKRLAADGIETLSVSLELHRKIASAFAPMIFIIFGLAFGLKIHHHERLTTYIWVLAVFMAYYLSTVGMNAAALKGWMSPWLAMWTPNILGAAVGGFFLEKSLRA